MAMADARSHADKMKIQQAAHRKRVAAASVVDQTDHAAERLQTKHFD